MTKREQCEYVYRGWWVQGNTYYILRTASMRILYCVHSTHYSHLVVITFVDQFYSLVHCTLRQKCQFFVWSGRNVR